LHSINLFKLKIFVFNEIFIYGVLICGVNEKLGKRRKFNVIVHGSWQRKIRVFKYEDFNYF
jgi:hypothetical protein